MARQNEFRVSIKTEQVLEAAQRLGRIDGPALQAAFAKAINTVTAEYDATVRGDMNEGIALSSAYVSSKMTLEPATAAPQASITTFGPGRPNRAGLTILGHYSPVATTVAAKGKAKGDPSRGIPAGYKAEGVQITVTRGVPKVIDKAFTMRLRQGAVAGDKTGVFVRQGKHLKHLYGVSPYSLFRFQVDRTEAALVDRLSSAVGAAIDEVAAQ